MAAQSNPGAGAEGEQLVSAPSMRTPPGSISASTLRFGAAASLLASLLAACAWYPRIPGERSWNPDIVVGPGDLSDPLVLDAPYVGKLDCYAQRCEKRFRVIADEPGRLTLTGMPELASDDAQMWMILESPLGVMARDGTGRGPREDAPVLAITEPVDAGTYFVLLQSVGGPIPYQLRAHLTPGEGGIAAAAEPEPAAAIAEDAPLKLVPVSLPGGAQGGYDPSVPFAELDTFVFRGPAIGDDAPPGTSLGAPGDRTIRRLIAEQLALRGFRQAAGREPADLVIDFSRRSANLSYRELSPLHDRYDFGPIGWGSPDAVATRGTLTVDIVESRSQRLAWHAWTTKPIGPGTATGEGSFALAREAVTEVLAGFPPP
jgi:hypothetical protein